MNIVFFNNQDKFREWLEINHDNESELIVGYYKVKSNKESMTWSQSVDQAICFGWIDGVRRTIDEISYSIRFTPRKKNSIWSPINIKKVEVLNKKGLMTEAGLKAYSYKCDVKTKKYYPEVKSNVLSSQLEKVFKENKLAWEFFDKQAPSYKRNTIHWIMIAKQEKTKLSRLEKLIKYSEQEKRIT